MNIPYRPDPGKTALVVIDMQKGTLEPGALLKRLSEYPGWDVLIPNHQKLLEFFRTHKMPIMWVITEISRESRGLMWTMVPELFGPPTLYFAPGKPENEMPEEIAPLPGETVVKKNFFDAFWGTNLEDILRTEGVEYPVFTGVSTTTCVSCSVRSAFNRQFKSIIVSDAVGSPSRESTENELENLTRCFARGMTIDKLIAELEMRLLET